MNLSVIRDFAELSAIESEWCSLTSSITSVTPFQSPVWLLTWWRHFGSGELRVFVFREGKSLVGIVPCFLHDWNGARQMTLIGSGISDYLEPPILSQYGKDAAQSLGQQLESGSDWEICNFHDLSFNSGLSHLAAADLIIEVSEDTECRELCICDPFECYWQARSKSLRQNVRRDRAKAEAQGELSFDVTCDPKPNLIDALIRLHAARWQAQGQTGTITVNHCEAFLREIARKFALRNMLRVFSLSLSGNIVAVALAFSHAGRLLTYLTAFDPKFEQIGLGHTLLYESLRYCFENDYCAWDFLRGAEAYKRWWGAGRVQKSRLIITRR